MSDNELFLGVKPSKFSIKTKRGKYYDVSDIISNSKYRPEEEEIDFYEKIDVIYRTLCAVLYNFAPTSGHPGGSISSGRIVQSLIFDNMLYDFSNPQRPDNDIISYAAGHKAMGLYAMWALRNELIKSGDPNLLPKEEKFQLRLEDLLGFRRNPTNDTPLFKKFKSKALDGHPSPQTPFIKISTGASGVGVGASIGLAYGAMDTFRTNPPRVNIIEGEGGLTPGRVNEALASAATSRLYNAVIHVDWNQASIDSNSVCAEEGKNGDYVQWSVDELFYINDWNVINVANGLDFFQILTAQKFVSFIETSQPTAVIYRTIKGWKYGIEGRSSHGSGHKFASDGYYQTLKEFEDTFNKKMPKYCASKPTPESIEECFYDTLMIIRETIKENKKITQIAVEKITNAKNKLDELNRKKLNTNLDVSKAYKLDISTPQELVLNPDTEITLREVIAKSLNHINKITGGSIMVSAADLYGSTSVNLINKGFSEGFYNAVSNPDSRLISVGGICEDAMGAVASGLSSYGNHIGVTSSYAAFISPLEHIAARLHAIGQQANHELTGEKYKPFIIINAHAGPKTGEDGPTHADPQALQILCDNFPKGTMITLTPFMPDEIWPLLAQSLKLRPAVIAPFVTRPAEKVLDRKKLGLCHPEESVKGIYYILKADNTSKQYNGTVVLQGNAVASIFVNEVMEEIKKAGLNMNVLYVTSKELFDYLDEKEKNKLYPNKLAWHAIGITDFTIATMYYWIRSDYGIKHSLHPFVNSKYLGSGKAESVLKEAGLDGKSQIKAIKEYASFIETGAKNGEVVCL
ncbi:MAG TPA: hypothetical protein PK103_08630 [Elusimicrobiales bacterium]|nr:hypothetical protein [Elusimicrobiales bacterium]HPO95011.1 hypothetical protein [Elusimicrobiales bacterium]